MHISLDSALGRQRRLNQVGESITQIAPDPAAAYSLRSLTGSDPKVVRVRRGSDNDERDFTASEVSSGALTSYVNAQVVAPLDLQGLEADGRTDAFVIAKAAYSLRSLGTRQATLAATGDTVARADGKFVVQVRRASDNTIKSFTAAEVSDGTLLSFVNQIQTVGTAVNGTGSVDNYTVTNLTTTGFSADNSAGGTGSAGFPYAFGDNDVIVVRYTVSNFSSTSSLSPAIRGVNGIDNVTSKTTGGTTFTANGTYTDTLTATADGTHLMFADGNTGSYTISDFEIVSHSSSGFVKTWYDQSVSDQGGSTPNGNHATQATADNQPKIVSAGALVTLNSKPSLEFDGTDDTLSASVALSNHPLTLMAVTELVDGSSPEGGIVSVTAGTSTSSYNALRVFSSNTFTLTTRSPNLNESLTLASTTNPLLMTGIIKTASSAEGFKDGTSAGTLTGTRDNWTSNSLLIGALRYSGGVTNLHAQVFSSEIIVYDTDQTDNRTAIEANIGETYSIDLPSGVDPGFDQVDGFVETWYDQSGNGRDATQATASLQPKIVDAGALVTDGIDFDGTDNVLETSVVPPNAATLIAVCNFDIGSANQILVGARDSTDQRSFLGQLNSNVSVLGNETGTLTGGSISAGADFLLFGVHDVGVRLISTNGTVVSNTSGAASNNTTHGYSIGANNSVGTKGSFVNGKVAEVIIYASDQSAKRTALETNIAAEYGITLS